MMVGGKNLEGAGRYVVLGLLGEVVLTPFAERARSIGPSPRLGKGSATVMIRDVRYWLSYCAPVE